MKIKNYIFFSMLLFGHSHSQSILAQQNQNYIIERVYQQAGAKEDSALVTVKYFDGLGRPLQTVAVGMSPNRKDIVTPIGYDALGREHRKYLPYEASSATGLYRPHDLSEAGYRTSDQYKYYRATGGNTNTDIPDTDFPFAETVFEASPLNRVLEQGAPGEAWQPNGGHTVGMAYGTNATDQVIRWNVGASGTLLKDGFYDAGTLYMTQTTDENGVASRDYKDLQGQVVLKMAAVDSSVQTRTYYVYDDLGHLRYVLPPMFVDSMGTTANFTASSDLVKSYGYYYAYDGRGRMTVKQLPGANPVYMVYDRRDRLVLTQDGNQRAENQWLFTLYDTLNRPVMSGLKAIPSTSHDTLLARFGRYTGRMCETTLTSGGIGYTTTSYSSILGTVSISDLLTVTYYDGYTQLTTANGFNQLSFVPKPGLIAYAGGNGYFTGTRGLVTGTKTRVLDTNEWLYGVTYYDDRYRPIQTRGTLYGGAAGDGYTASTRYDFSGKVLRAEEVQVFGGVATTTTTGNTYDHVGRLLTTTQQVTHNGTSTGTVTVAQNQFSALGQLREKNLANGAQSVDYTYNIRGWLTSINNPDDLTAAGNSDTHADLFGMRLSYSEANATEALPQYNGNIAGVVWSTNHNALKRSAYGYSYDALSRLTGSDYWTTKTSTLVDSSAYEERGIAYDLNGNIKTLVRTKGDGTLRDSLTYTYSGNRLTQLNSWNGYAYDGNGNMTTDGMRGFSVEYNLLNLPKKVSRGTDNISYIYSATGAKLAMLDTNTVRNYYAGTCVYRGDRTLDYALHPEGVVRVTTSTSGVKGLSYEYFLKDHLGNTRVVFNGNDSVLQATDYYAFGMAHTPKVQENENRYLYNGKEQQDALLGGVQFDWYDYGARFYDPMLGRWHSVDPLAEQGRRWSPYNYAFNNPIRFIDPDGMSAVRADGLTDEQWIEASRPGRSKLKEYYKWLNRDLEIGAYLQESEDDESDQKTSNNAVPQSTGVYFIQADARVVFPIGELGVTGSVQAGLIFDTNFNVAAYITPSLGGSTGGGYFAGVSIGAFPNAKSLSDIQGWGANAGAVYSVNGKGFGFESDVAIGANDYRLGITYSTPWSVGFGGAAYAGFSYTFMSDPINIKNLSSQGFANFLNRNLPNSSYSANDALLIFQLIYNTVNP